MLLMEILAMRYAWPEPAGMCIDRPNGHPAYTFLHFFGSVELLVDGKVCTTAPNACLFYAPGEPQWFLSRQPLVHDWIHVDSSLGAELERFGIRCGHLYYPSSCDFITNLFQELENEWYGVHEFRDRLIDCKLQEFLINFRRHCQENTQEVPGQETLRRYIEIRKAVLMNLDKAWKVEEMAEKADISPSRFHRVYHQIFGVTPIQDLVHARISTAKDRLLSEETPIGTLAAELGYASPYHFSRQFRQQVGCSPEQFRHSGSAALSRESGTLSRGK